MDKKWAPLQIFLLSVVLTKNLGGTGDGGVILCRSYLAKKKNLYGSTAGTKKVFLVAVILDSMNFRLLSYVSTTTLSK